MTSTMWPWVVFTVFVLSMLALDLGVFHRDAHVVTKKEAALWSLVWILLALIFNAGIYYVSGPVRALPAFGSGGGGGPQPGGGP